MRKEDKGTIIAQIAETVKEYSCFYLAETATLNAEKTSNLRRACFKEGIKMMVVKNALLHKALEGLDTDYSPLYGSLKGSTTMFFANVGNAPAKPRAVRPSQHAGLPSGEDSQADRPGSAQL